MGRSRRNKSKNGKNTATKISAENQAQSSVTIEDVTMDDEYNNNNSNNQFHVLGQKNENQINDIIKNGESPTRNNFCPPITIREIKFDVLIGIIKDLNIEHYKIKFTSFGHRLQCQKLADHEKLIEIFNNKQIQYFSFLAPEHRLLKFVLTGLHSMNTSEIKNELINLGLTSVVDVVQMKIKEKRYDDHCSYLVKFKRNSITINQLKQIRSIFHVIIRWEYYKRRVTGPPMCSRCQNFGHAAAHCRLIKRCVFCGEEHDSKTCNLLQNDQLSDKVKCCNCGEKHKANDPGCKKRSEYQQILFNMSRKSSKMSIQSRQNTTIRPIRPDRSFNDHQGVNQPLRREDEYSENHHKSSGNFIKKNVDFASILSAENMPTKNSLFTLNEITELVNDIVHQLRNCNNRADQFNVILQLSIKHLYSHGP